MSRKFYLNSYNQSEIHKLLDIYNSSVILIQIQTMADYDQNDENLMNKLQQIVPELRKQIQGSIRNRLAMDMEKAKVKKRQEINQRYQLKIKEQIEQSNQQIKHSLNSLLQQIQQMKKNTNSTRSRKLTIEEQDELIEQTVEHMLEDQSMLNEIKGRMRPRLQARVRAALQKELEEGVESMRREMQQRIGEEREEWMQERVYYWKEQSEVQLGQLAAEHNQLNSRKQGMQNTLNLKKMEKKQAEQRLEAITEKNALIVNLRAQLKQLKIR